MTDMYREHYAIAVLVNGKVQKEVDNTVVLPFETEYVLRLKNKQRKKAVADVHIDGRLAAKGIIVEANGTVDLERFVIDNLNEGARFKIVRKNDSRVAQPDEVENGNIEVRFYPEKNKPEVKVVEHHEYNHHYCHHHHWGHCSQCCNDWNCPICHPRWAKRMPGDIWYGSNTNVSLDSGLGCGGTVSCNSVSSKGMSGGEAQNCSGILRSETAEDAATVEGSLSSQRFVHAHVDVDYDHPVTLSLKLKGVAVVRTHCTCGRKRKNEKYCPDCGTVLAA